MTTLREDLARGLAAREAAGLRRDRRILDSAQGPHPVVDGRELLSFASNDYLGLAADPRLAEAARAALARYGTGAGAAHLLGGHSRVHHELEGALAEHTGRERALLFGSGYQANLGTVTALVARGDLVVQDKLDHASLIDAAQLSGAQHRRYRHGDVEALRDRLREAARRRLVITDGVFSMDGDRAPLTAIAAACADARAVLMVDDAHGYGVLGADGAGSLQDQDLGSAEVPVLMATLGKALGCAGAFVAGDEALIEHLINHARSYVYSTAAPPALAAAALRALQLLREEPERRHRVLELARRFRDAAGSAGLELTASGTPIQAVLLGSVARCTAVSEVLERRGILAPAVRPPTVPEGGARLRISLTAAHSDQDLERLLEALTAAVREVDAA